MQASSIKHKKYKSIKEMIRRSFILCSNSKLCLGASDLIAHKRTLIAKLAEHKVALDRMELTKKEIDTLALSKGRQLSLVGAALLTAQTSTLFYWTYSVFDWNLVEPITYLLGYSVVWLTILMYFTTGKDFTYGELMEMVTESTRQKLYAQKGLNLIEYRKVQIDVAELISAIDGLKVVDERPR